MSRVEFRIRAVPTVAMLLVLVFSGCATMPPAPTSTIKPLPNLDMMQEYRPISLGKIVVKIPRGQVIGGVYQDLTCYEVAKWKYKQSGSITMDVSVFEDVFREDLTSAGFKVAGDPNNLFANDSLLDNQAEFIVGALVTDVDYHLCRPIYGWNFESIKGWCHVKVGWQFFSTLEQRVVHTVTTEGVFSQAESTDEIDELDLWRNAFSAALNNLMADKGFLKLLSQDGGAPRQEAQVFETPVLLKGPRISSKPISGHMVQARDAAVLIHVGYGSHGSGFFVDKRGYILTNRHVTGSAKRITVEMSTGRKLIAEVLRSDPQRDIALLKVEDGVYPALPIQQREPAIGDEVYAIGAPIYKKLKFTVTKGIISAYREYQGLPILQSDVNIQGGNSGGPLLDDKGNVVAVCVIGYQNRGNSFGANGFIPIKSALERLNIKIK